MKNHNQSAADEKHNANCLNFPLPKSAEKAALETSFSRNTFTLIELLVVIAIIALLASILMPSLSRAQMKAKATQCVSNLKQAAFYHQSYGSDFKGYIMLDYQASSVWTKALTETGYVISKEIIKDTKWAFCPAMVKENSVNDSDPYWAYGCRYDTRQIPSYARATASVLKSNGKTSTDTFMIPRKLKYPSSFYYLGDTSAPAGAQGATLTFAKVILSGTSTTTARFSLYVHKSQCNIAAADGHVASFGNTDAFFEETKKEYLHQTSIGGRKESSMFMINAQQAVISSVIQ